MGVFLRGLRYASSEVSFSRLREPRTPFLSEDVSEKSSFLLLKPSIPRIAFSVSEAGSLCFCTLLCMSDIVATPRKHRSQPHRSLMHLFSQHQELQQHQPYRHRQSHVELQTTNQTTDSQCFRMRQHPPISKSFGSPRAEANMEKSFEIKQTKLEVETMENFGRRVRTVTSKRKAQRREDGALETKVDRWRY